MSSPAPDPRARARPAGPLLEAALVLSSLAGCSGGSPGSGEGASPADAALGLFLGDSRIQELLEPCPPSASGFYDRDTSELLPVLIEKLARGGLEPLRRAKEELGSFGEDSVEALRRCYERNAQDRRTSPVAENALDAAALNPDPGVREILLEGIEHPQSSVRQKALAGLSPRHVRPEDFDRLLAHVEGFEEPNLRRAFAAALLPADPVRARRRYVGWLADRRLREVWPTIVPLVASATDAEVVERCALLWRDEEIPWQFHSQIAAPVARAGDETALAFLREELLHEDTRHRARAIEALSSASMVDELAATLDEDPDPTMRVLALDAIGKRDPWSADEHSWLTAALDDPAQLVRAHALHILCERGDPQAIDRAVGELQGPPAQLQEALKALLGPLGRDVELAHRALETLLLRHELESHRPIQMRTATYKGIGLVPLVEAARFLRELGLGAQEEVIEGLRAHQWLMIQAANTGIAGRRYLDGEIDREEDPLRRLDLMAAVSSRRDDLARESMLSIAEGRARSPYEILYAAGRLVRIGPGHLVAPHLKRVSYDVEEPRVRVALQCLLWSWY